MGVAEDVGMAADDLAADRLLDVGQVEDAGLGRQLGVEDDLQVEVAELAGQVHGGAAVEGVVDLVGLLEQVLLERERGSARDPTGSRRGWRSRSAIQGSAHGLARARSGGSGAQIERRRQRGLVELAHGCGLGHADAAHRVIGRVEAPQHGNRPRGRPARAGPGSGDASVRPVRPTRSMPAVRPAAAATVRSACRPAVRAWRSEARPPGPAPSGS